MSALKLLAHATDGVDGIEAGIHLRWSFNHKLGFPNCVKLYRRESDPAGEAVLQLPHDRNEPLKFPYPSPKSVSQQPPPLPGQPQPVPAPIPRPALDLELRYFDAGGNLIEQAEPVAVEVNGVAGFGYPCTGEVRIRLSEFARQFELACYFLETTAFEIATRGDLGETVPLFSGRGAKEIKRFAFQAPRTEEVILRGTDIILHELVVRICGDDAGPWEEIKWQCGCGLPYQSEVTNWIGDVFPLSSLDLDLPGNLEDHLADWATMVCRLNDGQPGIGVISLMEYLNLRNLLAVIHEEGKSIPVGWRRFPAESAAGTGGAPDTTLNLSQYDFLLTQAHQVRMARLLDLYFIDKEAADGVYYDYKAVAEWPRSTLRRLDHALTFDHFDTGHEFLPAFSLDDRVLFSTLGRATVIDMAIAETRTEKALSLPVHDALTLIAFPQPVTEIQMAISNLGFSRGESVTIEAYRENWLTPFATRVIGEEEALVRFLADDIARLKLSGADIALHRLHYDDELFPDGPQQDRVCGLKKLRQAKLPQTQGLQVTALRGGPMTDQSGATREEAYLAGLRWDTNTDAGARLLSIYPMGFHVKRLAADGAETLLTRNGPMLLSADTVSVGRRTHPPGWPAERQFYVDRLSVDDDCQYQVSAVDVFGRESDYSEARAYSGALITVPAPRNVRAKFLDYGAYDAQRDAFLDPTLNVQEQAWLRVNQRNAIVVRWSWPQELPQPSRQVDRFDIVFQADWLNVVSGSFLLGAGLSPESLTRAELAIDDPADGPRSLLDSLGDPVEVWLAAAEVSRHLPKNALRHAWLKQKQSAFLILQHTAGTSIKMRLLAMDLAASAVPALDAPFTVSIPGSSAAFVDYTKAVNWAGVSASLAQTDLQQVDYELYLEDPAFPDPPIDAGDAVKIRYAQLGVYAARDVQQGAVSPPATVFAVYRRPPPPPPPPTLAAALAGRANVHGKSSFALRWPKQGDAWSYHVYRALDRTLIQVDREHRQPVAGDYYDQLTTLEWQQHANLAENAGAFTRISARAIGENDPEFADRATTAAEAASYTPDPATLLYVDDTLDGLSRNRYFYRLVTADGNGLQSEFGPATPPVEIPLPPPAAPVIESLVSGQRQVTLKWTFRRPDTAAGFLVYRTEDAMRAGDPRRMELLKDPTAAYSTSTGDARSYAYTDTTAVAARDYFYCVVAVALDQSGLELRSKPCSVRTGRAYDQQAPEPPVWLEDDIETLRVDASGQPDAGGELAVRLAFDAGDVAAVQIQKRARRATAWTGVFGWAAPPAEGAVLDRPVRAGEWFEYRIKCRSHGGIVSGQWSTTAVEIVED